MLQGLEYRVWGLYNMNESLYKPIILQDGPNRIRLHTFVKNGSSMKVFEVTHVH